MSHLATPPYSKQQFYDVLNELDHWSEDTISQDAINQQLREHSLEAVDLYKMFDYLITIMETHDKCLDT